MADILVPSEQASINAAIDAANTGDNIIVSTITDTVQIYLSAASVNGKTLTVVADTGATVIVKPTSGWPILGQDIANTGNVSFTDITFDTADTTRDETVSLTGDIDLTFTRCTFNAQDQCLQAPTGTDAINRNFTFTDCELNVSETGDCIDITDCASLTVSDCTLTGVATYANFDLNGTCGDISISNCEGTGGRMIEFDGAFSDIYIDNYNGTFTQDVSGNYVNIDSGVTTVGEVRVTNCNLSLPRGGVKVESSVITGKTYIANNDITVTSAATGDSPAVQVGFEYSTQTQWELLQNNTVGQIRKNDGVIYICHQAIASATAASEPGTGADWKQYWEEFSTKRAIIENNTLAYSTPDQAHALFVGYGPDNTLIKGNTVSGGNWQIVSKANGCVIIENICDGIKTCLIAAGDSNTVLNNVFRATSDYAFIFSSQDSLKYTSDNYVANNLMSISSVNVVWSDENNPTDGGDFVDRNVYYRSDGGDIVRLGGENRTLSELVIQWAAQSTLYGDINDQNSSVQNFGTSEGILIDGEWIGIPQTSTDGGGTSIYGTKQSIYK